MLIYANLCNVHNGYYSYHTCYKTYIICVCVCVHTCMVLVSCLNKRKRAEFKGIHLLYLECMPSMVLFGKQFLYIPILRPLVPLLLKIFLV